MALTLFGLFFPASGYFGTPKHCKARTQNDKSTLLYPPTSSPPPPQKRNTAMRPQNMPGPCPVLPFLGFSVLPRKNLKFTKDFSHCRTHKILGKDRENTKITKEIPCLKLTKEILKTKEWKDRVLCWNQLQSPWQASASIRISFPR